MVERTVKYNDLEVVLKLDMGIGIGGDKWPAAELFCNVATDPKYRKEFSSLFDSKRTIELGSGTGLGGIIVDKLYAPAEVFVTDLLSHVDHMDHNLKLNSANRCKATELDWGKDSYDIGKFDVILAFECVYKVGLYEPFVKTLRSLSSSQTVVIMGMTRQFLQPKFFTLLTEYGFQYSLLPQETLSANYCRDNGTETGLFICKLVE
jgi:predicted nicotinamide N-methyase